MVWLVDAVELISSFFVGCVDWLQDDEKEEQQKQRLEMEMMMEKEENGHF